MVYNSNQVAEIVGVNVSTIKRWTVSGKLNCYKSAGGHRKFHLNHIKEFLKKNKRIYTNINVSKLIGNNQSLLDAINNGKFNIIINYCIKSLVSGNSHKFFSVCNSLILIGNSYDFVFDNILIPLLDNIGKKWLKCEISISEEHMASIKIKKFLSDLNDDANIKSEPSAFCFTLINDEHDIPLYMSELIFNETKVKVHNLGSNLPMDDFLLLYNKYNPKYIFISIVYISDLDKINNELNFLCRNLSKKNTTIIIKGGGTSKLNLDYKNYKIVNSFKSFRNILCL